MSFSSFYSVVNAIKDKSAEAMTILSSDLQDFKSVVQEDVAELSKNVRQNIQDGRLSVEERKESDQEDEKMQNDMLDQEWDQHSNEEVCNLSTHSAMEDTQDQNQDSLTSLKNSLFSMDMGSTLESLNSVGSSMQGSLNIVQDSLTSVGSKLTSLNVGNSLESLEVMGSKLLNSADKFIGTLTGDTVYEDEEKLSESELSARRFRVLALQEDSETYIEPPLDVETFEKWKLVTSTEELAEIKKEVLENYPTVGCKFKELVPSVVGADVFWAHYIYKASLLAAQEQRGADLLEHALNDDEEEIDWDADSPKAKDDDGKPIFPDDECKEEEKVPVTAVTNAPTSSSDGESWIELDERKESTSSGASSSIKEPNSALADLTLNEGDEAAGEGSLDWGDDDDLLVPEETTAAVVDAKVSETTPILHEDSSKRGEDWGEWD
ncbi:hypothetical protein DD237_006912 [Peronospora effusa]|uniref:BSD domain-containing protein n=1 Tax=Peronospora effusa TaxID=542832 RepID=A0A3R7XQ50_9STRA|nr:hypothetical protein DD237_006912 [Peronospora effusa]